MWKMKKIGVLFLSALLTVSSIPTFVACRHTGGEGEQVDPNRKQIYVGYYNGGMGLDWIYQLKYGFEELYPEYQVMIEPDKEKYSYTNLRTYMPTGKEDIYFTTSIQLVDYMNNDMIADITEAVTTPLTEYGETESIVDKMNPDSRNHYAITDGGSTSYYAIRSRTENCSSKLWIRREKSLPGRAQTISG